MVAKLFLLFSCFVAFCAAYSTPPQCNPNEVLSCVNECPAEKTCRTRGIEVLCKAPTKPCESKCVCQPGYFRSERGDCITDKQCDQCKGDNEFFACDSACDNVCLKLSTQNRTNCPIKSAVCNPMCYCNDGFARDDQNQCVPVEKCPLSNVCNGPNEEHVDCKRTCPPELCEAMVTKYGCRDEPPCKPGCACKPGFYRIEEDKTCDDPNEEYEDCKRTCPPDVCFSIIAFFDCRDEPPCEPGCTCKPGYYRKETDTSCVRSCECDEMYYFEHCEEERKQFEKNVTKN